MLIEREIGGRAAPNREHSLLSLPANVRSDALVRPEERDSGRGINARDFLRSALASDFIVQRSPKIGLAYHVICH